ncbi:unnamed protein product [Prunus armeniaca]|uniref:RING-type domain-containing protein n=1 Tax=Prunus armeniaca TaxID=36596 RepID=A0A6J5XLL9_PRUAR|nr:unnamed protein product [Prunus armeniaca]
MWARMILDKYISELFPSPSPSHTHTHSAGLSVAPLTLLPPPRPPLSQVSMATNLILSLLHSPLDRYYSLGHAVVESYHVILLMILVAINIYLLIRNFHANQRADQSLTLLDIEFGAPTTTNLRRTRRPSRLISYGVPFMHRVGKRIGICSDECVICMEEFKEGEYCRFLSNCRHTFHQKCIDDWLATASNCPVCRDCVWVVRGDQNQVHTTVNIYYV